MPVLLSIPDARSSGRGARGRKDRCRSRRGAKVSWSATFFSFKHHRPHGGLHGPDGADRIHRVPPGGLDRLPDFRRKRL